MQHQSDIPQKIPIEFNVSINKNKKAKSYFESLDRQKQSQVFNYLCIGSTKEETLHRISSAVSGLEQQNLRFL